MTEKRDFKGVWIPKEIWLNDNLSALEKIVLTEIDSLDCDENCCYASNEYFANFCQVTETTISTIIKKLINDGYISLIKFDGRRRYIRSNLGFKKIKSGIKRTSRQTLKNLKADFKNLNAININNNTINNKDNNKRVFKRPTLKEIEDYIKEKGYNVDSNIFFDYFESNNWIDSKGNKVKSWKQKIITWNSYGKKENKKPVPNWFDKEINESDEGKEEIEKLLEEYR